MTEGFLKPNAKTAFFTAILKISRTYCITKFFMPVVVILIVSSAENDIFIVVNSFFNVSHIEQAQ